MDGSDAIVVDPGGDMNGGLGKVLAFICDHKLGRARHPVHASPF